MRAREARRTVWAFERGGPTGGWIVATVEVRGWIYERRASVTPGADFWGVVAMLQRILGLDVTSPQPEETDHETNR